MAMSEMTPQTGLLHRTLKNLRHAWSEVSVSTRALLSSMPRPDLPPEDLERVRDQMVACFEARGGEPSARAKAADLGQSYLSLNEEGRAKFLRLVASDFNVDEVAVDRAMAEVQAEKEPEKRRLAEERLRTALEPKWRQLLRRFTSLPDGVKFLVDLRAELLKFDKKETDIKLLSDDLKVILESWFDVGLLDLRLITWDSPASLLEKLIAYEAVHAIKSWDDLKNRLDSDRRCFAFFHHNMPDEPLIFVEVALVNGLSGSVDELLDEDGPAADPDTADTAIFYSISNAQKGLAGIGFGDFLIKRVVGHLSQEHPNLKTFATLSPIPGFKRWLGKTIDADNLPPLPAGEIKALEAVVDGETPDKLITNALDRIGWADDEKLSEALKSPMLRLAAHYLAKEKRNNVTAFDPVAHFHLSNGARMERLNWLGDRSDNGMRQSAGMMINYSYRRSKIESNNQAYVEEAKVATSSSVRALLRD